MAKMFSLLLCIFTINDVFGDDPNEVETLFEGDSLTLKADFTEMQKDGLIEWSVNGSHIVKINKETGNIEYTGDKFGNRLKVDQRGFLFMWNIRIKHSGSYEVESTSSDGTKLKTFNITVKGSPLQSVEDKDEVKSVAAPEGTTVTLKTDVKLQKQDLILWRFGAKGHLIAKWDVEDSPILYYGGPDGGFRDRLQMEKKNGSLTIKNIRKEDAGEFKLKIVGDRKTSFTRFSVTVNNSGLSPVEIAIVVLLVIVVVVLGFLYYRHKTSKQQKQPEKYSTAVGEDVTIKTETKLNGCDKIQWLFKNERSPIAEIKDGNTYTYLGANEKFKDRLELDKESGSLTIKNIKHKRIGIYTLKITRKEVTTTRKFLVCLELETKQAQEGEYVTLYPDNKIQRDEEILWIFGDKNELIAKMTKYIRCITYSDKIFSDSLYLDKETGSLTIKNITLEHAGNYRLEIRSHSRTTIKNLRVFINDEKMSFMVGMTAELRSGKEIQHEDKVEWKFQWNYSPIAEIKDGQQIFPSDGDDELFRGRLTLNENFGSLTINNIRCEHAGIYELKIKSSSATHVKIFTVVVNDAASPSRTSSLDDPVRAPDGKQVEGSAAEASRLLPEDGQDALYANKRSSPV